MTHGQSREISWHGTKLEVVEFWTVEQSPAQQRSSRKTKAAKSTFIVLVVPKEPDWEQFFADVERSLAD